MRFFWLQKEYPPKYSGECPIDHRWGLPGANCSACNAYGGGMGEAYPAVDLSKLPERALFEEARLEDDFAEFVRLRELVRPLAPPGALLTPGAELGPLTGMAQGQFPPLILNASWMLLIRREALEQLQAEGLRGLKGVRTELRFREKTAPELLELQVEPAGLLHPDCLPPGMALPCATCGRARVKKPAEPILDGTSIPPDRDLFRLATYPTMLVCTERFCETVLRLGFEEVHFLELPVRP